MSTLDDIKARAAAATPGPWIEHHENGVPGEYEAFNCPPATGALLVEYGADSDQQQRDTNFIAHAREDVPRLVAALEAVQALIQQSAPHHLNQDGESGWQCAMDHLESAIDDALEDTK